VLKAIHSGLSHLVKCHLTFHLTFGVTTKQTDLILEGINILSKKCNNKHIRHIFQSKKYTVAKGKFYWSSFIECIDWTEAWLLPHKYCISNKIKEVHFKILHNDTVTKYMDVDSSCTFCGNEDETLIHLFFQCEKNQNFWNRLYHHIGKHLDSYRPFQLNELKYERQK